MKNQRGMASLLTAMVALLIMTITAFYLNAATIAEVINTSNQSRSSKAFEAAEAGLNDVLAKLNDDTARSVIMSANNLIDVGNLCDATSPASCYTLPETALSTSGMAYSVIMTRANTTAPIIITSTGGKAGCLTDAACNKKTIITQISPSPFFKKMPPDAMSSPGNIAVTGSICVQNSSGNGGFAGRAGLGLTTTNNLQGAGCAASNGNGLYGGISTTDSSLGAMNGTLPPTPAPVPTPAPGTTPAPTPVPPTSDYFEYAFGISPSEVRAASNTYIPAGGTFSSQSLGDGNMTNASCSSGNKSCGKIIWVDANSPDLGNKTYGTVSEPVIIIVTGAMTINGSPEINGMLYVAGSLQVNGSPTINGALMAGGAISGNGNFTILYDKNILDNSLTVNAGFTMQSGSWHDWKNGS